MGAEFKTNWRDFIPVYEALNASPGKYAIVGGQACNVWAERFLASNDELQSYKPFTSQDLDVYVSDTETAKATASKLGRIAHIGGIDSAADVVLGAFRVAGEDTPLVQFLKWSRGVERNVLEEMRVPLKIDGVLLYVMHPLLTLQSKVHCLAELPQQDRQDVKHAKMAVCYSACYLHLLVGQERIRPALDGFEHSFEIARSPQGIKAWRDFNILPENALPTEALAVSTNEKFTSFREKRLPQLQAQLADIRKRNRALF